MLDLTLISSIIGWCASLCAAASYAFSSVRAVRLVNCLAAVLFVAYGVMIAAPSICIMNASLIIVHVCYLTTGGRFGDAIAAHPRSTAGIFALYAIAMVSIVIICGGASPIEMLGVVSSVGFVGGFLLPGDRSMRAVCSCALVANIAYAIGIGSAQIVLTNGIGLVVNIVHLVRMRRSAQSMPT